MRWITTTNHKTSDAYLWFSFIMFFRRRLLALTIRTDCSSRTESSIPILQFAHHAARPDHDFRRDHAGAVGSPTGSTADDRRAGHASGGEHWSFWCCRSRIVLIGSFFVPEAAAGGWTLYGAAVVQAGMGIDLTIFAIHIMARRRSWARSTSLPPFSICARRNEMMKMPCSCGRG